MRSQKIRLIILLAILVGLIIPAAFIPLAPWLMAWVVRASHWGLWGPVALGGFCVASCVLLIPVSISTLAAGFLFGVVVGGAVAVLGTTVGACAAFLLSRLVVRRWLADKAVLGRRFAALDRVVGAHGFKIVLLLRLSPLSPFIVLNYALGLMKVSFRDYAWGTLLGSAPGTMLFVFFGAGLRSLGELLAYARGEGPASPVQGLILWIGLAIAVAVIVWLMRVAAKAIRQTMREDLYQGEVDSARQRRTPAD